MLKDLVKLANHLDNIGRTKEADYLDNIIKSAFLGDSMGGMDPNNIDIMASAICFYNKVMEEANIVITPGKDSVSEKDADIISQCVKENTGLKLPPWPTEKEMQDCTERKFKEQGLDIATGAAAEVLRKFMEVALGYLTNPLKMMELMSCIKMKE